jgi:hypothetical protein
VRSGELSRLIEETRVNAASPNENIFLNLSGVLKRCIYWSTQWGVWIVESFPCHFRHISESLLTLYITLGTKLLRLVIIYILPAGDLTFGHVMICKNH